MFNSIKLWYQFNLWDKALVKAAVVAAWITADQYKTIVGEDYQATVAASAAPADTTSAASDSTAATSGTANVTPVEG